MEKTLKGLFVVDIREERRGSFIGIDDIVECFAIEMEEKKVRASNNLINMQLTWQS